MSAEMYYDRCCQHINRAVEITCNDGVVHRGIVHSVDHTHVYLRPIDDGHFQGGPTDHGLFFWGAFAGGFAGALTGVALGRILFFRPYGFY